MVYKIKLFCKNGNPRDFLKTMRFPGNTLYKYKLLMPIIKYCNQFLLKSKSCIRNIVHSDQSMEYKDTTAKAYQNSLLFQDLAVYFTFRL